MSEENNKKPVSHKAKQVAKATAKASGGDWVGGAVAVAEAFSEELKSIVKGLGILLLSIILLFVMLFSMFENLPGLIVGNIEDMFEKKATEWVINKTNKDIKKAFEDAEEETSKEIINKIEKGYIKSWESNVNNYWNGDGSITGKLTELNDQSFGISKEKNNKDLLAWQYHGNETSDMFTMVRFKNYNSNETTVDSLYLISAYSVWHQNNDDEEDQDKGDKRDLKARWRITDAVGLKRFIKKHKKELLKPQYSYTDEVIKTKIEITQNGKKKKVDIEIPCKVLNVSLQIADEEAINKMFDLDYDQTQEVKTYSMVASTLFEVLNDKNGEKYEYIYEPRTAILKNVFHIET